MNPDEQTTTWVELTNCLTRLGPDDLERFLSCFTSDVYYDDSFLGVHQGHEGLTRLFDAIYRDGADYHWQFFDQVITGATGYARYILSYTSTMPGSQGKDVLLEGVSMVKLKGGLISEYREVTDMGPALARLDYPPARIKGILDRKASTLRKKYGPAAAKSKVRQCRTAIGSTGMLEMLRLQSGCEEKFILAILKDEGGQITENYASMATIAETRCESEHYLQATSGVRTP